MAHIHSVDAYRDCLSAKQEFGALLPPPEECRFIDGFENVTRAEVKRLLQQVPTEYLKARVPDGKKPRTWLLAALYAACPHMAAGYINLRANSGVPGRPQDLSKDVSIASRVFFKRDNNPAFLYQLARALMNLKFRLEDRNVLPDRWSGMVSDSTKQLWNVHLSNVPLLEGLEEDEQREVICVRQGLRVVFPATHGKFVDVHTEEKNFLKQLQKASNEITIIVDQPPGDEPKDSDVFVRKLEVTQKVMVCLMRIMEALQGSSSESYMQLGYVPNHPLKLGIDIPETLDILRQKFDS